MSADVVFAMKTFLTVAFVLGSLASVACASPTDTAEDNGDTTSNELSASSTFVARGTGYFPDGSAMEGGFTDRKGAPLHTLQQFLAGQANYVSVAMDTAAFPYGQRLSIQELNTKYGKNIVFEVVDTGGAFQGKGRSRIDICTANEKAAEDPTINGTLHISVVSGSGPAPGPTTTPAPTSTGSSAPPASGGGGTCSNDGMCNPGSDGAGLICVSHQCVPGCHSDAQCPGATSCVSGQCE